MKAANENCLISVYGVGKLKIKADIIRLRFSITNIQKTVSAAQKNVNAAMSKVLNALDFHKVEKDWIQTTDLNFHPQYEWKNNSHVLVGQKVEHEIICTIPNIETRHDIVRDILDSITTIYDSIECKLSFDISNYESRLIEARELAYMDAYNKAQKYAELGGLKIVRAIKISEFEHAGADYVSYEHGQLLMTGVGSAEERGDSTEVSVGNITLESKLFCDFIAK
jgi:uncharacterized protein YggE